MSDYGNSKERIDKLENRIASTIKQTNCHDTRFEAVDEVAAMLLRRIEVLEQKTLAQCHCGKGIVPGPSGRFETNETKKIRELYDLAGGDRSNSICSDKMRRMWPWLVSDSEEEATKATVECDIPAPDHCSCAVCARVTGSERE